MFGMKVKTEVTTKRVERAADKANFRNFGHAAASISKDAKASIETDEGSAPEGSPPHSRKGQLRRAIRYAADKEGAVIGAMESVVGQAGAAHEHGEEFRGQDFDERPFMAPALDRALPRMGGQWRGSIGE